MNFLCFYMKLNSRAARITPQSDERWSAPDLRRIRARALGDNFDARIASDEAVCLGGVLWQLRIALDLARALVE